MAYKYYYYALSNKTYNMFALFMFIENLNFEVNYH